MAERASDLPGDEAERTAPRGRKVPRGRTNVG